VILEISPSFLQEELGDDTCFPCPWVEGSGAAYGNPYLRAGITSENRSILDYANGEPVPFACESSANSRKPSSYDNKVVFFFRFLTLL
jgi:hypothetical protein